MKRKIEHIPTGRIKVWDGRPHLSQPWARSHLSNLSWGPMYYRETQPSTCILTQFLAHRIKSFCLVTELRNGFYTIDNWNSHIQRCGLIYIWHETIYTEKLSMSKYLKKCFIYNSESPEVELNYLELWENISVHFYNSLKVPLHL